ncbi:MAG: molybdenum cofactor guanylyltransferase [Sphingomonadales bacterium]
MTKKGILGVILSGGGSARMGRDKALVELNGKPLINHVYERFAPQVDKVIISGPEGYGLGVENLADFCGPYKGPIAGLYAVATCAKDDFPEMKTMVTVPVDAPFLPEDLVEKLLKTTPSVAGTKGQMHPTFANWGLGIEKTIEAFMDTTKKGSLHGLARFAGAKTVQFDEEGGFLNINTLGDLNRAKVNPSI